MASERAICQKVRAANSRLAAMLRRREDDDAVLQIGWVKFKELASTKKKSSFKGGRAATPRADFTIPLPRSGRPRAADGITTTFHFEISHVTKSDPTGSTDTGSAVHHAIYVERSEAVETGSASKHARYVEREEAVEIATRPLVFSNISTDAGVRRDYWRAVERCERAPHPGLDISPTARDGWWKDATLDLPYSFLQHCEAEQCRRAMHRQTPEAISSPFEPKRFHADRELCDHIIAVLKRTPDWSDDEPPVALFPGLGGRTQYRLVAELPYELSQSDRIRIVDDFCAYLGSFARNREGEEVGMMYTAAIHAPGPDNHKRNYHLHVIAHDRPASWLPVEGQWDFEYAEQFKHRGEVRTRYPYRQDKIPEVTRRLAPKKQPPFYNDAIAGKAFIPHLRERFASICNERLAYRRFERRIDARSHEALGIDKAPEVHLGTSASALERLGVSTSVGNYNQATSWRYHAELDDRTARQEVEQIRQASADIGRPRFNYLDSKVLEQEQMETLNDLEELIRLSKEHARLCEQALSKAQLVRINALKELKMRHSHNIRLDLETRIQEAERHIGLVQNIIRQNEPDLRSAKTERGELVLRYYQIDLRLTELAQHQKRLNQVAKLNFATTASPFRYAEPLHGLGGLEALGGLRSVGTIGKTASGVLTLGQLRAAEERRGQLDLLNELRPIHDPETPSPEIRGFAAHASPATITSKVAEPVNVAMPDAPHHAERQVEATPPCERTEVASDSTDASTNRVPVQALEISDSQNSRSINPKAQIENLLDRISKERIPISVEDGRPFVNNLSQYDASLLRTPALFTLIKQRLLGIAKNQQYEIDRLIEAVKTYGSDLEGPQIPPAVRTLSKHWAGHPKVQSALRKFRASGNSPDLTLSDPMSKPASRLNEKLGNVRGVDVAREHARRRDKDEWLVASKKRMDELGKSSSSNGKSDVIFGADDTQSTAPAPMPTLALTHGERPGKAATEVELTARRNGHSRTARLRDHTAENSSPRRSDEHVDLNRLLGRLGMITLPLREATIVEKGQERKIIAVVIDNAMPEDAELAALAMKHQTSVAIQEILQRQFDMVLIDVRSNLIAEPNASSDRLRELLNPKNDARLNAMLAAVARSPSFIAIVEAERAIADGGELSALARLHEQLKDRGAGRK